MNKKLDKELNDLSPNLAKLKRQPDGFRMPEGYFDSLEGCVMDKLHTEGARPAPRGRTLAFPGARIWLAAASIVGLSAGGWFICNRLNHASVAPVAMNVEAPAPEELEAFILENINEFEPEELVNSDDLPVTEKAPAPVQEIDDQTLNNLLDDLSDEELEELL